jgi:Zn-finger nucleic acid-binding protein
VEDIESDRICPRCNKSLQTIDLKISGTFLIERCTDCLGLFFDPGELEALLEKSVSNVFTIDSKQIEDLNKIKRHEDYPVSYIKCPVCQKLMNRLNFGSQSGVIVDKCKEHGIWLDGGELRHLMEWTKSGGKMLDQQSQLEQERLKLQQERQRLRESQRKMSDIGPYNYDTFRGAEPRAYGEGPDLLGLIAKGVSRLFRIV